MVSKGFDIQSDLLPIWTQSSSNYLLGGKLIEQSTNVNADNSVPKLQEVLENRIFSPLGMTATIYQENSELPFNMAHSYERDFELYLHDVTELHPSVLNASGSIITTAEDLGKFVKALFTGSILTSGSLELLLSPYTSSGYGFGMFRRNIRGGTVYYNDGEIPGYRSQYNYYPDQNSTIIILINTSIHPTSGVVVDQVVSSVESILF